MLRIPETGDRLTIRGFFGEWAVHLAGDHPPRMNPPAEGTADAGPESGTAGEG